MRLGGDDDAAIADRDRSPNEAAENIKKHALIRVQLNQVSVVALVHDRGFLTLGYFNASGGKRSIHIQS
jgi:hypothetical protein